MAVERYVFISTISVYPEFSKVGIDENNPVGTMEDATIEEVGGQSYGPLKALCERAVQDLMPGKAITIRPGLIVGPHDPTNRFSYWRTRGARGGDVLVPRSLDWPTQLIDARDLGAWTVTMAESGAPGVYNATGPDYPLTFGEVFNACRDVVQSDARPVIVSEEFFAGVEGRPLDGIAAPDPRCARECRFRGDRLSPGAHRRADPVRGRSGVLSTVSGKDEIANNAPILPPD